MISSLRTSQVKSFSSLISKCSCLGENVKIISNDIYNLAKRSFSNNKNHNSDDNSNELNSKITMSKRIFWDRFYTKHNENSFEWLVDYSELISNINEKFLAENVEKNEKLFIRLLDAGCGTSMFGFNLSRSINLPVSLVCADFSREALNILRKKHNKELLETKETKRNTSYSSFQSPSLTIDYIECNCKYLPFKHDSFDIIVDKGYLDSVLKATSSNQSINSSLKAICNLLECLNVNGYLLQITDETPDLRMSLFDQFKHDDFKLGYFFKEIDLDNDRIYYAYFLRKIKY